VTKTRQFPIQNDSQKKFGGKVESKIGVKSTDDAESGKTNPSEAENRRLQLGVNDQIPKQTNKSNTMYHKEMQNSRSESEQKRIDSMYHIFQQAGLLSRAK